MHLLRQAFPNDRRPFENKKIIEYVSKAAGIRESLTTAPAQIAIQLTIKKELFNRLLKTYRSIL